MFYRIEQHTAQDHRSIDEVVQASCRMANQQEITSVHVISSQRPTYDGLLRIRQCANARGVDLTVDASGVSFRRRADPDEAGESEQEVGMPSSLRWPMALPSRSLLPLAEATKRKLSSALDWLSAHGRTLRAELNTMSEGTR
jgi:hypothetical protein